jgi:sugar phosphate isomerase/epimerase
MKRREFVQTAAFAGVGLLSLPSFMKAGKKKKLLGLQLYSLRQTIPNDPKGVLQKVAGFGYKELEAYSYRDGKIFGMDYTEFCNYVKGLGMKVTSGHYGIDQIKGDTWKKAVEDAKKNDQPFMVMPYLVPDIRKTMDDYKRHIADLNAAGEVCNSYGIRFQYHNHDFEFLTVDGQVPYDVMLKELDPKKVGMELDLYWVVYAGKDPLAYFEQYPGRFEQWHIKDMDKTDRKRNADVGTGSIDFKAILAKAKLSGCKHFYVEQETYPGEPIDSVGNCATYLKTIL